jgi:copper chaperone CopZ
MKTIRLNVGTLYCYDCVKAIRRFVGSMKGVESVDVDQGYVTINYNEGIITEEEVRRLVSDTVERLGYRVIES